MADRAGQSWAPSGMQMGGGMVKGVETLVSDTGDLMLHGAPKWGRIVARGIPGAPGLVLDAAQFATARNKARAGSEIAGGMLGGFIGSGLGPLGAAAGAVAGQKAGEWAYDHHDEIREKMAATAAWVKAREAQIARGAMNEFQVYTRPPQAGERF